MDVLIVDGRAGPSTFKAPIDEVKEGMSKICFRLIEEFEKEKRRSWLDFARGFISGYGIPEEPKPTLSDFKKWLENRNKR